MVPCFFVLRRLVRLTLFPYTTLFRSGAVAAAGDPIQLDQQNGVCGSGTFLIKGFNPTNPHVGDAILATVFWFGAPGGVTGRSEEHTSELQSLTNLVCRLLLEKKKTKK